MKEESINNKRFYELDYLRGLGAISVALFHFTYGYDNGANIISANKFYFKYGNLGVQLFFLISGFVIFMTLNNVKRPLDFVVSRFSRLYPSYWVAVIFSMIFVLLIPNPSNYDKVSLHQFLLNMTMFQHFFLVKDIDGAYWTLAIEITFYIIMFILFLTKQFKNIIGWSVAWLLLCAFCFYVPFSTRKYLNALLILQNAPMFIAGMMFYKLYLKENSYKIHLVIFLSLFIQCYVFKTVYMSIISIYIILSLYLLFYYLTLRKTRETKKNKFLYFFGSISYTLYLIHENVGVTIIYNLKKIIDNQLFYIPITLIIVISIATLISKYLERPIMKLINNRYKNFKSRNDLALGNVSELA